ncbi:MAG: glutathione-dependent reductase [SAR116 cluster bacterium MED-G05]|jgi:putative glutathione S-transferase|nr:glutathione-dependent reductase [Rhodospirillaceae bacterium]PDH62957.1 MAG: glutathione-dependent reductase [SAR116 cluster bacterium MED-G05]HBD52555.1 glutathione-dependent reductase [Alphaproteobacteria bacterium]MAI22036.1 glutathione-dependent reductase [Rhodospirillaceae bacterium]MAS74029.1 glutathione-dependent reductase [Rhodospirillaceae bacterium]|tara:strand:+ start:5810 stop:6790 length:981 start_codon:yes stop_codon:yes gene_type:complete
MGQLIDGTWSSAWYDTKESGGHFVRDTARFRNWITADGSAGPAGEDGFAAESGRYHLYISFACPWAHRTLIFRHLKGLASHIGVSSVHPLMLDDGWTFAADADGGTGDHLHGASFMHQIYTKADPAATGRVTVPVLWDRQTSRIVSNESSEIIRMFNSAFNDLTGNTDDYCPPDLRADIDAINADIYDCINNGVYRSGFATTHEAYADAVSKLFDGLDRMEAHLSRRRYLVGDQVTEADWRFFTTLIRFDAVYVGHFKCNIRRIADYPALSGYMRELYQMPGIADTVRIDEIKRHYYASHRNLNPTGIIPVGPELGLDAPHDRAAL